MPVLEEIVVTAEYIPENLGTVYYLFIIDRCS